MKIELKPHKAKTYSGREVEYDEQIVWADGHNVGKIGNKEGSQIAWFRQLDLEDRIAIEAFVSDAVGWPAANSHMPPDLATMEDDDDDDDADD